VGQPSKKEPFVRVKNQEIIRGERVGQKTTTTKSGTCGEKRKTSTPPAHSGAGKKGPMSYYGHREKEEKGQRAGAGGKYDGKKAGEHRKKKREVTTNGRCTGNGTENPRKRETWSRQKIPR